MEVYYMCTINIFSKVLILWYFIYTAAVKVVCSQKRKACLGSNNWFDFYQEQQNTNQHKLDLCTPPTSTFLTRPSCST